MSIITESENIATMAANNDVARIAKEGDEAREQNAKLHKIAERAIADLCALERVPLSPRFVAFSMG